MYYEIDKKYWHSCQICGKSVKELAKIYGGSGIYFTKVIEQHLIIEHNNNLNEYFKGICRIIPPICACGICNKECSVYKRNSKMMWQKWVCGRFQGVLEWSEKAKETRKGSGNPMCGKKP